jgi:hypothetical protein
MIYPVSYLSRMSAASMLLIAGSNSRAKSVAFSVGRIPDFVLVNSGSLK